MQNTFLSKTALLKGAILLCMAYLSSNSFFAEDFPLEIDADSSDCGTNLENCTLAGNVIVRQGDAQIRADKLFSRSENEWELDGNIVIEKTGMQVSADRALVALQERQLKDFTLIGSPVNFQYLVGSTRRAQGRANNISFDLNTGKIVLDGNARLLDGANELRIIAVNRKAKDAYI